MKFSSLFEKPKHLLTGRDIYVDKKDRLIYYNKNKKQGFVIAPGQESTFKTCRSRYLLGLCAFALVQIALIDNFLISGLIGVAVAGILEFRYRKFLNKSPMIQNYDLSKAVCTTDLPPELSFEAIVLRVFLFVLLSILLIVNLYTSPKLADNMTTVVITYLVSVGSIYFAIKHIVTYQKQVKANKK